MFSNTIKDILTIVGLIISIGGFAFAIWQIIKTKKAAFAAKEASINAREALQTNIMLVDMSLYASMIDEIKSFLRNHRYESALIRVTDLISQLIQIRHMEHFSSKESPASFQEIFTQLSILRENLEQIINDPEFPLDIVSVNKILSGNADLLYDIIGKYKFSKSKEN